MNREEKKVALEKEISRELFGAVAALVVTKNVLERDDPEMGDIFAEIVLEEMQRSLGANGRGEKQNDGLSFGHVIEAIKKGKKAARKGWNGKEQYIELATNISYKNAAGEQINAEHLDCGSAAIAFVGTRGVQLGWLASQSDMLSDDWVIVED